MSPHQPARPTERGMTLLEVTVMLTLFVTAFVAVWQSMSDTSNSYASIMYSNDLDRVLRSAVARIVEDVANSGTDESGVDHVTSHPPGLETTAQQITLQRRIAMNGDPADWSGNVTFDLQPAQNELPANGADDDGDGLVDEMRLMRTEAGGTPIVIADGVSALSITRTALNQNAITILLTVVRPTRPGANPASRTSTTTVALRNRT
ncbi:MAG: type II secretion system protein J [Planctomycetota bacterium]